MSTRPPPKSLDIVIPMAGRGSRFTTAGYDRPKPLIDVSGQPMIQRVIANLRPSFPHRFVFLVLEEHLREFALEAKLKGWAGAESAIVPVKTVTEGAACTVLLAEKELRIEADMVIANSDQILDVVLSDFILWSRKEEADGSIMVFEDEDEKWSFARLGRTGDVVEVAEKRRISNLATAGIYYFRSGRDFVTAAEQMIAKNIRVNNEFYVCPVYNEISQRGQRVVTWKIVQEQMLG
ncbi:MAG: glycosyltransferase family 2 protein, partial [Bdellovibrionales bacterium]